MNHRLLATLVAVLALVATACGDGAGNEAEAEDTTLAYCEQSAALDDQDGPPTEEQLTALVAVAPDAIREDIAWVADKFVAEGMQAFGDPEMNTRMGAIEAWENEHCEGFAERRAEDGAEAQEPDPDAAQVAVTATDFAFEIDGDVPAGKVAFVMTNDGDDPHHMGVVRFAEGVTLEQAEAAAEDGTIQELIDEQLGESVTVGNGETSVLNVELAPGLYGMACFVSGDDGVPHFFKGMRTFFTVS